MIKILLVGDHNIVRNGIKMLLETDSDFLIVGEAMNVREVREQVNSGEKIDIILADINIPELDEPTLIKQLREITTEIRLIVLSEYEHEKYVATAFIEGADGYLIKNVSTQELIFALKFVYNGGKYLCAELSLKLLDDINNRQLMYQANYDLNFSLREIEVLNLIAEGLTNLDISEKLFISKRTVEGHRQSLLEKTNSKNTAVLIRFAVLHGLIS